MATNADELETIEEEVSTDLIEDLKQAKAADKPSEETEQVTNTESAEAEEETQVESEATFTKEVPSIPGETPEEYYKNLEKAYQNSTTEALRLKGELDKKVTAPPVTPVTESEELTPEQMYLRTKIAEETQEAFKPYLEKYPQLKDETSYKDFVNESELLGRVFVEKNKRLPSPNELYSKTVASLGWSADNSEELGSALKDTSSSVRVASAIPAGSPQSKVTEEMIGLNLKMYPNKSRQEIIEELEPHIN